MYNLNFGIRLTPAGCRVVVARLSWSSSIVLAADYGGMPDTLLQHIFSCCNLAVRSKLSCQQVCRSWKECLKCTRNCLWAKSIEINLSYGARKSTRLLIDDTERFTLPFAAISLGTDGCFFSWLARQATNVERMTIRYKGFRV